MADGYISAVRLPGNNTYDIKDKNAITEIQIVGETQTKTNGVVNLPAHVTQSNSSSSSFRPILTGHESWNSMESYTTGTVTDGVYKSAKAFLKTSNGTFYGGYFVAANPVSGGSGNTAKRATLNSDGIYANNYLNGYSIAPYERQIIQAYAGKCSDSAGLLLRIDSGGLTIIGGGESGQNLAGLIDDDQTAESPARLDIDNSQGETTKETTALLGNSEHLILASDGSIYFVTKCNSTNAPNRVGVCLSNERVFYPMRDNTGSIGSSSYRWANGYFKLLNNINTVNYQKATDSGDTKYPAKWYCSMGKTPADGDIVTITVPAEGGNGNGVYLSIEGNTNAKYKPISVSKVTKLTTHFGAGEIITLVYRAAGSTDAIYPINGGTATTTVSGGCWSVLNYYNTNTDTKVTQTNTTGDASYRILFSNTADNTSRTEAARKSAYLLFNPNTKTLTTTNLSVTKINGVAVGDTPVFTDTDTKVIQSNINTTDVRPLIMENNAYIVDKTSGTNKNIETDYDSTDTTGKVYRTNNIYASPANGRLYLSSTSTPQMYLKYRTLDYTLANNGMSSEQWVGYRIIDKNSKVVAIFNLDAYPDGKIGAFVRAGNYNSTTSSAVSGYMGVLVHKNGSVSYSISHKDKFREAIEVYSKLETETSIRSYLTSTVGHSCKNLLNLSKYTYSSGISNVVTDEATGSLSFTGTGTNRAVNVPAAFLGMEMYDGKTYTVSCVNNLASTTTGRLAIRRQITNDVVKSVSFSTTGNKSITFTSDEETFPNGWYISVMATGSTSTTGKIDISNFMLREASITDDTFEPYVTPTDSRIVDLEARVAALEAIINNRQEE